MFFSPMVFADKLTIYTYSEVPFATQVKNTKQGLVIEFLEALLTHAKIDYQVQLLPLKRGMALAESKKNTCVLPIERNQQRESQFKWFAPVMISRYGLFSDKSINTPLITLSDVKSNSIGSFLGSGIGEYLSNAGYKVQLTTNDALNLRKLQRNRIDFWAADIVTAKALMAEQKIDFGEPELIFFTSIRAMACNSELDKEVENRLQNALIHLYKTGYMSDLNKKYGLTIG
ncbi:substrate-binding periplasmic protein [Shewanella gaetbuli]